MATGSKEQSCRRLRVDDESPEVSHDAQVENIANNLEETRVPKRKKRGPTKMKTIAMEGASRIEIKDNGIGQLIGEGSISLSSFLGPLVREIVPFTISDWRKVPSDIKEILWKCIQARYKVTEGWQKDYIFKEMGELWRASKSRLVSKIRKTATEEERLELKPGNIKTTTEWKNFLKLKSSAVFKAKSKHFRDMKDKQIPHTTSRKGFARLADEISKSRGNQPVSRVEIWVKAYKRNNGDLVNTTAAETIEKLNKAEADPLVSKTNLKEDALSKVLGVENRGRLRGLGKGVTLSQLTILSQRDNTIAQMKEEQNTLKEQVENLTAVVTAFLKNQDMGGQTSKNCEETSNAPVTTMSGVNTNLQNKKCKLLDWLGSGEVVAEGRWSSSDPYSLVHHIPIGPNAMRVWVDVVKKGEAFLWRPTSEMTFVEDAVGSIVAWPADKVDMGFAN